MENKAPLEGYTKLTKRRLPEPIFCEKKLWDQAPKCRTVSAPRYGSSLTENVVFPSLLPPTKQPLNTTHWQVLVSPYDAKAVNRAESRDLGYLDIKWVIYGTKESGPLVLRFDSERPGSFFFLCHGSGQTGENLFRDHTKIRLDGKVIHLLSDQEARTAGIVNFSNGVPEDMGGSRCYVSHPTISEGEHLLEILPIASKNASIPERAVPITHLVWW